MNTKGENLINIKDNQQERPQHNVGKSSETTRRTPNIRITKAYLLGLIHDATKTKYTYRIGQKNCEFVNMVKNQLKSQGYNAWTYREGSERNLYIVEFAKRLLSNKLITSNRDKVDYIRGYFDAEGGTARDKHVKFYIYFAQKNLCDLSQIKSYLQDLGINCGKTHNPSNRKDPNYWRFYVRTGSHDNFINLIGSYHPEKSVYLRMKI